MKLNKKTNPVYTHGGAVATKANAELSLRRSVMSCLLWEDSFYEDGESIADRIVDLVGKVKPEKVARIAVEARNDQKLRHVPLLLARAMAKLPSHREYVEEVLTEIIQRPDELSEYLSIYWKNGKEPLSAASKRGLARAFLKFDEYQLAKYAGGKSQIKLRDVMNLVHPVPANTDQAKLWKKLLEDQLETPNTWEVALSSGGDKKKEWTRLIEENALGGLAILRNLRNMEQAGVNKELIRQAIRQGNFSRVLPFRFIAASKHAPKYETELEEAMFRATASLPKLTGKTLLVVDTSGSMWHGQVSRHSDLSRVDAATALTILLREQCEDPVIYATAGNDSSRIHATTLVPARRGFALHDAIWGSAMRQKIGGGGIFLKQCMDYLFEQEKEADRIIVLTDEQDCDVKCNPSSAKTFGKQNYLINVSVEKNGIGYGKWTHISGWSEGIVNYILNAETNLQL